METLKFVYRFEYGCHRFFPNCELSFELAKFMRQKCFTELQLRWIRKIGLPFEIEQEEFLEGEDPEQFEYD